MIKDYKVGSLNESKSDLKLAYSNSEMVVAEAEAAFFFTFV